MAYVKILRGRNVVALEEYIFRGREPDDPVIYGDCMEGTVAFQIQATQKMHKKSGVEAIHIIQSYSKEDSNRLLPEEYTQQGAKLVEKMFPGHQFVVATHTDTDKIHNHILVNPYSTEDGKKINNKLRLLYDLRAESDRIAREKGLSVIEKQSGLNWEKMSEDVRGIKSRQGFSWVLDLKEKCDFARKISTSFDEYAGVLNQFGIEVRVENKNVQYHYPGRKQKRGNTRGLSQKYGKEGLIDQFKKNYEKFFEVGLKKEPIGNVNFEDHWKFHRGSEPYIVPEYRYKDLVVPVDLFKKMEKLDLKEVLKNSGMEIEKDESGELSIKDKDHIKVSGSEWWNKDKGTVGGPLELMSYLEGESFLKTLGRFDESERIKRLIEVTKDNKPSFQAFYLPKELKKDKLFEQKKMAQKLGFSAKSIEGFLKRSRVKFSASDRLKFVAEGNKSASLTFYKLANKWVTKRHQGINQVFYSSIKSENKKTVIFKDPVQFLGATKVLDKIFRNNIPFNVVVPLQPLDEFLKKNEEHLRKQSAVAVMKDKSNGVWGDDNNDKEANRRSEELMGEMSIGYESIDELLRALFSRSTL